MAGVGVAAAITMVAAGPAAHATPAGGAVPQVAPKAGETPALDCFHVEIGSNATFFAVRPLLDVVGVAGLELREQGSTTWTRMRETWGDVFRLDSNRPLRAPFSLRLTNELGVTTTYINIIPANWTPEQSYCGTGT
ncbi:expansin C-terminal domain-related protein [Streptomyces lavendulae]|uniref:expansin C-terminal domain-related protein n=1 Tax=Streptomyces lavendulae TaxID=1914 RepID=UPI00131C471B|nr:expansin C-terminal domain-related protein [Streptomyces lavendulae]